MISGISINIPDATNGDDNSAANEVSKCLLRAEKNKESNLDCKDAYLHNHHFKESTSAVYWRYEKVPSDPNHSDNTDACIVFSGPAKNQDNSSTTLEFRKCSHDYTDTGCAIPHMVWSSNSKNRVPVALLHTVEELGILDREEVAR